MAKNSHYCIVDHMGSLTQVEINEVYKVANATAKNKGFEQVYKMSEFVQTFYPRARNITGVKWVIRHQRNPELVLFICPNEMNAKVKAGIEAWRRPNVELILIQPQKERLYTPTEKEASMCFDYGDTDSKKRMIANIWASALGYTFDRPLYRTRQDEIPDQYMKTSSRYANVDPDKLSKYSTKSETYLESKRTIASPKDIDDFYKFYVAVRNCEMPIEDFLEPDYRICPNCGRPYRVGQGSTAVCPRCDYEEEDTLIESYWDDRGEEPEFAPSYDAYDIGIDVDDTWCGIPHGKKEPEAPGPATFEATDYTETWKWYNTWE